MGAVGRHLGPGRIGRSCRSASVLSALTLAFSTAGDAAEGLLFGWDIATFQKWALIYLGASSLAFVVVWLVGYLRSR
jgi:hypothetical protein